MKRLESNQTEMLKGGQAVTREEYCGTLRGMFEGGGYQGDIGWFMETFYNNCGRYGIPLFDELPPE